MWEPCHMGQEHAGVSRRTTIKGIAAGGAISWAAPQILTTPAAHAQSAPAIPCDCPTPASSFAWNTVGTAVPAGAPVVVDQHVVPGSGVTATSSGFTLLAAGT